MRSATTATTTLEALGAACAVAGTVGAFLFVWWVGLLLAAVVLFGASWVVKA